MTRQRSRARPLVSGMSGGLRRRCSKQAACAHSVESRSAPPHACPTHLQTSCCESWLSAQVIGAMGRSSPSYERQRSGSRSPLRLISKSRSPLRRHAPFDTPRATLKPRSKHRSKGTPRTGTPRSQRQRAPSPYRMKCESPRDPEQRRRAWNKGESVASPVPLPFDEVVPREFSPDREEDLPAAPSTQRCKTSAGRI